jgi:hypothetical protein
VKSSVSSRLRQCVTEFKDVFTNGGKVLFCQARDISVVTEQHLTGSKYYNRSSMNNFCCLYWPSTN